MNDAIRLIVALGLNALVAVISRRRRSVTVGGAAVGLLTGAAILYLGGWGAYVMLILFFVSATIASRIGRSSKTEIDAIHEKSDERDAVQVVANSLGTVAGLVLFVLTEATFYLTAAAGAFAAANADTWASELGVLSARRPRSIVTGKIVPRGMSGGVTWAGTLASAGGSLLIAGWFALWRSLTGTPAVLIHLGLVAGTGVLGSVIDSVLGATVQAEYRDGTGSPTERSSDGNRPNALVRGVRGFTNDAVNLVSTVVAGGAAGLGALLIG